MKCYPLEIPDFVASALESGELIIFAGAGVSMGRPAKLPSYSELADRIADKVGARPRTESEPYDR